MRYVPFGLYLLFLFLFRWKTAHFIGPSSCCLRSDVSFLNLPFSSEDFLFSLSSLLCWHHHIICFSFCQTLFLSFYNIQNISLFSDFCMFFEGKTDRRNHAGDLLDSGQSGYSQSASLLVEIIRNPPASGSFLMIFHNRVAASQLIRSGLYHSCHVHCHYRFFCNSSHRLIAKRIPVSGQICFSSGLLPECNLSGLIIHALHDCKGLHADSL